MKKLNKRSILEEQTFESIQAYVTCHCGDCQCTCIARDGAASYGSTVAVSTTATGAVYSYYN